VQCILLSDDAQLTFKRTTFKRKLSCNHALNMYITCNVADYFVTSNSIINKCDLFRKLAKFVGSYCRYTEKSTIHGDSKDVRKTETKMKRNSLISVLLQSFIHMPAHVKRN